MKPILRPLLPLLFLAVLVTPPTHAEEALATLVVRLRPVALTFPVESVVEAVQQAVVSSQVSGRLVEVLADGGDRVKKGELLARIDSREAAEQVQAARAQYLNAKADYERSLSLFKQKFVSQAAMDRAKAALDSAAAQQGAGRRRPEPRHHPLASDGPGGPAPRGARGHGHARQAPVHRL